MEREWTPRLPRGVRLREDRVRGRWVLLAPERIFEIDCPGLTSPTLHTFAWTRLPRPVYPLDEATTWVEPAAQL